jgi:hypothetical protein
MALTIGELIARLLRNSTIPLAAATAARDDRSRYCSAAEAKMGVAILHMPADTVSALPDRLRDAGFAV